MLFKDLKQGYQVYLLHKGNDLKVTVGKVTAVSLPRFPQKQNSLDNTQLLGTVVDVTIDDNGVTNTYPIPDSFSVACVSPELTVSIEKSGFLKEIDAIQSLNEDELSKHEARKNTIERCKEIRAEWNMEYKEKKETEERFGNMERRFGKIEESVDDLKSMFGDFLKKFNNERRI